MQKARELGNYRLTAAPAPLDPAANLPELLTTTEAAAFLRVSRRTVADWCLDGTIRAFRLGSDWRIPRAEVRRLLAPAHAERGAAARTVLAEIRRRRAPNRQS